jgi:hypothetical protein
LIPGISIPSSQNTPYVNINVDRLPQQRIPRVNTADIISQLTSASGLPTNIGYESLIGQGIGGISLPGIISHTQRPEININVETLPR